MDGSEERRRRRDVMRRKWMSLLTYGVVYKEGRMNLKEGELDMREEVSDSC